MKLIPVAIIIGALFGGPPAFAQPSKTPDVANTSFVTADGARTLQDSIVIDAPVATLWKAFTDAAEYRRWAAPMAAIDFRVGGSLEASYNPKSALGDRDNIRHRIVTFIPQRLIVFQNVQAPRQLPDAEMFQKTVTVLEYDPLTPTRTRVTLSSTGWGTDAKSDRLYRFFEAENPELLEVMKKTYEAPSARQ